MIHANFIAEGALEKPDVIGALFGQTEGLLGTELEMRELQKEGKIGRIEVDLQKDGKRTIGEIKIPTALDQSETTLIAAAIETIERIGPSDAQIEITRIEDVRGSKRDYIIERAKKLMMQVEGSTDSREISNEIKGSLRVNDIGEFGKDKVTSGDLSGNEVILVEGRADLVNLMKSGVKNVLAMNGTKLPEGVKELSQEKDITLFVDGDRGGKLIIQNVLDNAKIKYIAIAPDGKEVEELAGKDVLIGLRKRMTVEEYLYKNRISSSKNFEKEILEKNSDEISKEEQQKLQDLSDEIKDSGKAILLNRQLEEIKSVSAKSLFSSLRGLRENPYAMVIDGTVTSSIISAAEEVACKVIVAKNFAAVSSQIKLLSL
jgi:DNA primase